MVNKDITVISPASKGLSRRKGGNALARLSAAGHTLIQQHLSDEVVKHFALAAQCSEECGADIYWVSCFGLHREIAYVERAKAFYRKSVLRLGAAHEATMLLDDLLHPDEYSNSVTREQANCMLHFLFNSMGGKARDKENSMTKLAACSDIFSPTSNILGRALELWKPVPQHPTVLALAIKQLKASSVFQPEEPELRTALANVIGKIRKLERGVDQWIARMCESDAFMFKHDRDGWQAAHVATNADSVGELLSDEYKSREPAGEYYHALDALYGDKFYAENPEQRELEAAEAAKRDVRVEQQEESDDDGGGI